MIKSESTYINAPDVIENALLMTDSEAGADGEAVVITSSRLTKCGTTASPDAILVKNTEAGTDVKTEYVRVNRYTVYLADYTSATTNVPAVGGTAYALSSDGLKVDADTSTGGYVEILSVDTAKKKCRIMFRPTDKVTA